ncbi:General transcription factor 3C polypeptide 5 [Cichlidogyrus casuarinus]|uniref:General transcription factor 3C polypeptide 5 n=1 Tax=Cichlidogyrus casuarinus TaxID=1844966 RepID=A0ABD2Q2I5_9PLAT
MPLSDSSSVAYNRNINGIFDIPVPEKIGYLVKFPGVVKDQEKAVGFLGGLSSIDKSFTNDQSLSLRFRPEMIHSGALQSSPQPYFGIVLRKEKLRHKQTGSIIYRIKSELVIFQVLQFSGLFSFNYCPFVKTEDSVKVFYKSLLIDQPTFSLEEFLKRDAPLYTPALNISKTEVPLDYKFAPKFKSSEFVTAENLTQAVPYDRKSRKCYTVFRDIGDPCPLQPVDKATEYLNSTFTRKIYEQIQALFKTRPVWSKLALRYHLNHVGHNKLKNIIPCAAYYSPTGPWKRSWVRFGYDPFTDPESRKLQIVDVRITSPSRISKLVVQSGMSDGACAMSWQDKLLAEIDQYRSNDTIQGKQDSGSDNSSAEFTSTEKQANERKFRLSDTSFPISKQTYYQLIDIEIPEVKSLYEQPPSRYVCCSTNGWLEENYQHTVRTICYDYLKKCITKTN